jgi:hypothetical protein
MLMGQGLNALRRTPAWLLLAGVAVLAIAARTLIAVIEQAESRGRPHQLGSLAIVAMLFAAALGAYVGRRAINRPAGLLLAVAGGAVAALGLAGSPFVPLGMGLGAGVGCLVLMVKDPRRLLIAVGCGTAAATVVGLFVPSESPLAWGLLGGGLLLAVAGFRPPRRAERSVWRWTAFGVRTLALVAVLALMAAWASYVPVRLAIFKVRAADGEIHFHEPAATWIPRSAWYWRLAADHGLVDVLSVAASGSQADDELATWIGRLPGIEHVSLYESAVTDDGLARLASARSLNGLHLGHSQISARGLERLAGLPSLTQVTIEASPIGDAALTHLAKCPALTWLSLSNCGLTAQGLGRLKGHPALQNCYLVGPEMTQEVLQHLPGLPAISYWLRSGRRPASAAKS